MKIKPLMLFVALSLGLTLLAGKTFAQEGAPLPTQPPFYSGDPTQTQPPIVDSYHVP